MKILNLIDEKLKTIAPVAIIILLLFYCLLRVPFYDEAHAYIISQLPFLDIFSLTKVEGHSALWFLLLKIFAPSVKFYPYNLLFFNWIIASLFIIFFYRFFPFNNIIKTLICLSAPFFHLYGVVARPYTLALLILVFIVKLYLDDPLKKPYLYSALLVLFGYTNIVCTFGSLIFLIFFIYDINKSKSFDKKKIFIISSIFVLGGLSYLLQVYSPDIEQMRKIEEINQFFKDLICLTLTPLRASRNSTIFQMIFNITTFITLYTSIFMLFKKNNRSFIFLSSTYILMTLFFSFVYVGSIWHYYFYLIYLMVAYVIGFKDLKAEKIYNSILILYLIVLLNPYSLFFDGKNPVLNSKHYIQMVQEVKKINFENSKIYCFDYYSAFSAGSLPYLVKNNIDVYDVKGNKLNSKEGLKYVFKNRNAPFNLDNFDKIFNPNEINFLVNEGTDLELRFLEQENLKIVPIRGFIYKNKNHEYYFEIIEFINDIGFTIYRIYKIK